VAAFIRRCGEFNERALTAAIADKLAEKERGIREQVQREVESRTRAHTELLAKLAKVKEETGIDLSGWQHSSENVAKAIKFAMSANLQSTYGALGQLERTLERALTETRQDLELLKPGTPAESPAS